MLAAPIHITGGHIPQHLSVYCMVVNTEPEHQQVAFVLQHAVLALHGDLMGHVNVKADLSFPLTALAENAQSVAPPRSLRVNAHPPRTLYAVRTSIISNAMVPSSAANYSSLGVVSCHGRCL